MNLRERPFPELIVALASAAWGLFWIPLRAIESQGLAPAWATLSQFLVPLACLTPLAVLRHMRGQPSGVREYRTGLLVGSAVALYLESLLLTDVARALILFYAMPAWGTILEVGLMKRPLTRWRLLSLVLSLSGLLAILGADESFSFSMNFGDVLALASGILFAFGYDFFSRSTPLEVIGDRQVVGAFAPFGSQLLIMLADRWVPPWRPGRRHSPA
jgi:drug/metabolite transporter (DMT)-like permease